MLVPTACPTSISKFKSHDFCFRKRGLHPQSYNFPLKWPRDDFSRHKAALSTSAIFRKKPYWNRRENIQFLHHQYFQTTSPHPPPPPAVDRMTEACENITFPQLMLRTVIILQMPIIKNFSHNNYRKCLICPVTCVNWIFCNKKLVWKWLCTSNFC